MHHPRPHYQHGLLAIALILQCLTGRGAEGDGILKDQTFSPTVHTVEFFKKGFALAPPVIDLLTLTPLVLRFDDLQPNAEYLSYSLVHCDADWRPSDLMPTQYQQGPAYDVVTGPSSSFNTLQPFLEYEIEVPNAQIQPTVSGNFVLKVFRGSDQEDLVLTRRFLVYEQRVQVDARMTASRDVELREFTQQIDLTVRYPGINIQDPFNDLNVVVLQNLRWDDARTDLKPKFVRDRELVYDMPGPALFRGGNEWRNYDIKDIRFATQHIAQIVSGPRLYEVVLLPEGPRAIKVYFEQPDLNGKMLVRNDDVDGDPLGTDYVQVHFTLPMEEAMPAGDVFVYGALSDMQCLPAFRMEWDADRKAYVLDALVKQGFVDYCYAWLPEGDTAPDLTRLEGTFFQTENDYVVLVYVRDHTLRCDRLMAVKFINTRQP